MLDYQEYLRYKALCEAFDAADPATYFDASPELQAIIDEQAERCKAEYQARLAAQTPADCGRWDTMLGNYITCISEPTPQQIALVKMLNIQCYIIELAEMMGWEVPNIDYIGRYRGN